MKVNVDKDICIGCGACQAVCPDVFEIDDDGLAKSNNDKITEENMDDVRDALEGCPVGAITEENNKN